MWHPAHLTWEQVDKIIEDSYKEAGIADPKIYILSLGESEEDAQKIRIWKEKNPGKPLGLELAMQIDMMMGIQKTKEASEEK